MLQLAAEEGMDLNTKKCDTNCFDLLDKRLKPGGASADSAPPDGETVTTKAAVLLLLNLADAQDGR